MRRWETPLRRGIDHSKRSYLLNLFRSAVVTHRSTKLNCPLSLIYRVIRSFNPRRSPDAASETKQNSISGDPHMIQL